MLEVICKPIDTWPGEHTSPSGRRWAPFDTPFPRTMNQLRGEIESLGGRSVVLEIDLKPDDIRLDGWPRAAASVPPPVKLSFDSRHGPLVYATDVFDHWHDNVRAIALGLEALRKVDRYGITQDGQQYKGWAAIGAGTSVDDVDGALDLVATMAGVERVDRYDMKVEVRAAKAFAHPDRHGGGDAEWTRLRWALETLGESA